MFCRPAARSRRCQESCVWTYLAYGRLVPGMVNRGEEQSEIVPRLFYLITAAAEDAAAIAVEGQSLRAGAAQLQKIAARLRSAGETIEIVASALEVLLSVDSGSIGDGDPPESEVAPEGGK